MVAGKQGARGGVRGSYAARVAAAGMIAVVLSLGLWTTLAAAQEDKEAPKAPAVIPEGKTCADCHKALLSKKHVHPPVEQDCENCHESDGNRHRFELMAPAQKICVECHEMEWKGERHRPVAKGQCTECHEIHASDQPALLRAPGLELCGKCHEKVRGARKSHLHGPFGGGNCSGCHDPHASPNDLLLKAEGSALCLSCHEGIAPKDPAKEAWHAPAEEDCTACHHPHESDHKGVLLAPVQKVCFECHEEIEKKVKGSTVVHKAMSQGGGCADCHEPHASRHPHLLAAPARDLCLKCHSRSYAREKGRPIADVAVELEAPHAHGPVGEGRCGACHDPHGENHARLLRGAYPESFYARFGKRQYALCFSCHKPDSFLRERTTTTGFRDRDRNLHFLHVNRVKGRTCRACHTAHASTQPHQIRETTPFGNWQLPIGYEKSADGGTCTSGCHVRQEYSRTGRMVSPTPESSAGSDGTSD